MTLLQEIFRKLQQRSLAIQRKVLKQFERFCVFLLKRYYFQWYPLNENLGKALFGESNYEIPPAEVKEINNIRLKNVIATLLSQTGSLFALVITLFFGLASISFPGKVLKEILNEVIGSGGLILFDSDPISNETLASFLFFLASIWGFFKFSPLILRKVINHLSPEEYAKITIGSLTHGQLLTFLAYKNWGLIENLLKALELDREKPMEWWELEDKILKHTTEEDPITKIENYIDKLDAYLDNHFKDIQHCIFMVRGSYERLGINKRELTNHILKFSPAMFYDNLNAVLRNLRTVKYFKLDENSTTVKKYYIQDFCYLIADVSSKRKRLLEELIFFKDTHKYIIGMSSHTSTSLSLKVFLRGISEVSKAYYEDKITHITYLKVLKSILHRSKAHCGVDLLISLESFERKYILSEDLDNIKQEKDKKGSNDKKLQKDQKVNPTYIASTLKSLRMYAKSVIPNEDEMRKIAESLKELRQVYREKIHNTQEETIFVKFENAVKEAQATIEKENVAAYFIIFGYSELVRQCLRKIADSINKSNIKVFILQDDGLKALDTRTFLFELNKDFKITERCHQGPPVRKSFTGKDAFIKTLVDKNDLVYFLAGAEVYDQERQKLLHTNRYQRRVEKLVEFFRKKLKGKKKPQMWVIAEKYKVYNDYPNDMPVFGDQFYQDYYETLDMYDLKKLFAEKNITLISDSGKTADS